MTRPTPTPEPSYARITLADLLRARRDSILSSWQARAKQLPAAEGHASPILLETAAALLDRFADPSKIAPVAPIGGGGPERLVAEIQLLRRAVHEANAREPWPAPAEELAEFDDAVDGLIVATVAQGRTEVDALRWSEARLRAMFEVSPVAMFIKDTDGRFVMVNRVCATLLGGSPEQVVGRLEQDLVPPDVAAVHLANDRRALESGRPIEVEESLSYEGELRSYMSIKFPASDRSGRSLACGVATDITDRKRIEDGQRFLAEGGRTLGSSLDYEDTLSKVARYATTGFADACAIDVVEPHGVRRLGHAPDPEKEEIFREFLEGGPAPLESMRPMALAIRTRGSIVVPILDDASFDYYQTPEHVRRSLRSFGITSVLVVPLLGRDKVLGAIGLGSVQRRYATTHEVAITEGLARIASAAIENSRLYAQAQEAARHREDVLAIVSHDLRSPLLAIRMSVASLSRCTLDEPCSKYLAVVDRAARRMDRLIGDLLEATAIRTGHLVVTPRREKLSSILAEAIEGQNGTAKQRGIRVVRATPHDPIEVSCDRDRIVQVLSNLLGNALKFCRQGDTVTIATEVHEREVRILVSDTGPGIEEPDRARLFDPYWSARRHESVGTGLGLFISKGLVEAHGGQMGVESRVGHGTTFWFTLPRG